MAKIDRQKIYDKLNGRCGYCGESISIKEMQVDHIIPKVDFVTHVTNNFRVPDFLKHLTISDLNHIDNLMPTCRVCNKWKTFHPLEIFRRELSEQIKRLNDYSANYRIAKKYGLVRENEIEIKFYFERL
jgi:5-methylcytosine-specific restriction endonuclease McrA